MKIVVLAGGISPERDVSLSSGALIAGALTRRGHQALLLDLCFGADARGFDAAYAAQARNTRSYAVPDSEPDLDALRAAGARRIGKNVVEICADADVVFLALHGDIGENGMLQALFAIHGIRHTGTGYAGSLLAMDKTLTKQLLRETGILTPAWRTVDPCCGSIPEDTPYPCVVKPCGCGSSVGVSIVDTPAQLAQAVDRARKYEQTVLIEEKIEGREFSVGVLDGKALPAIEIIPRAGFYDYKNKYQAGLTEEVCPADIPAETETDLRTAALRVHRALRLGSYSRVDFILRADGAAFCLEANTLPGMTPTSLLPQEAAAAGISYDELCQRIVELALRPEGRKK